MKKITLIALILAYAIACKHVPTRDETVASLKKAMLNYLTHQPNYDASRVQFDVQDVYFFEDKTFYTCQFKVKMVQNGRDTIGNMFGTVSKDFATVHRKW
jgi:hypothetical protein